MDDDGLNAARGIMNGMGLGILVWLILILSVIFLAGCAGVTELHYVLKPQPNTCQVTEARATAFSTLVNGVCWDGEGRVIGMTGAGGKPGASVPLEILGAVATVAAPAVGAYILGTYMLRSAETLQGVKITVPEVPVRGTVDLPANVPPITVNVNGP